jgi:hypothetical protein
MINLEKVKEEVYHINVPDYSNQESINRITTNGGSWTVDRDGFIHGYIQTSSTPSNIFIYINDKVAETNYGHVQSIGGTHPVKKGDIVKVYAQEGTFLQSWCYYIPPVKVPAPKYASLFTPDWSKQEVLFNRSDVSGTFIWTADRYGFVIGYTSAAAAADGIYINGVAVGSSYVAGVHVSAPIPVIPGDVVSTTSTYVNGLCRHSLKFYPPKVTIPPYVNENISTTEIIDTGKTLDGKHIKRWAYRGTAPSVINQWKTITTVPADVEDIISWSGCITSVNGFKHVLPGPSSYATNLGVLVGPNKELQVNMGHNDFISRPFIIILEYTEV